MSPAETLSSLVQSTAPGDLPALAAELARATALVMTRIVTVAATAATPAPASTPAPRATDDLITIEEAAQFLSVETSWLYRNWRVLGLGRKIGRRTLRFDRRALERWVATRPKN